MGSNRKHWARFQDELSAMMKYGHDQVETRTEMME